MTQSILVEQTDAEEQVEPEAQEAAPETQEPELPEKYQGKSLAEVIEMHQNAEGELGRRANEVGHYRSLVSELVEAKRSQDLSETQPEEDINITSDDLLEDPTGSLQKVVEASIKKHLDPIKQEAQERQASTVEEKFNEDFPNAAELAQDQAFIDWVQRVPSRVADAVAAAEQQDFIAARRLLENYNDMKSTARTSADESEQEEVSAPTGVEGAKRVATESSGNGGAPGKKIFYQDKVVNLMLRDPEKYRSDSYQKELQEAIKEGRFRK